MKKKLKVNRLIIIGVLVYFIYAIVAQQSTIDAYDKEAFEYQEQIEEANDETAKLENVKNNMNSPEYIESAARERLDMYLPNERVYIDVTN